jgi:hypothetical protein
MGSLSIPDASSDSVQVVLLDATVYSIFVDSWKDPSCVTLISLRHSFDQEHDDEFLLLQNASI